MDESMDELNKSLKNIEDLLKIDERIISKVHIQRNDNIINIIDLYNILQPILKEKHIVKEIIDMKYDMELCKLRNDRKKL